MTSYLRTTDVEACTLLTEVPPNLGKVFQRTWESTPLCVEVQPQMLHSHEELDLSGEYVLQKNTKFKGANVNCNSICLEICKGEMDDLDFIETKPLHLHKIVNIIKQTTDKKKLPVNVTKA